MEMEKVNEKALTLVETLRGVATIKTSQEYSTCGELWKAGKEMMRAIDNAYNDLIVSAYENHKKAVAKKKSFYLPVEEATKYVKNIMSAYDEEQDRIRREKEIELRKEAMRIEEEARLQAEYKLRRQGKKKPLKRY